MPTRTTLSLLYSYYCALRSCREPATVRENTEVSAVRSNLLLRILDVTWLCSTQFSSASLEFHGAEGSKALPLRSSCHIQSFAGLSTLAPIVPKDFRILWIAPFLMGAFRGLSYQARLQTSRRDPVHPQLPRIPLGACQWSRCRYFFGIACHPLQHVLCSFPASPQVGLSPTFDSTRPRRYFHLQAVSRSHTLNKTGKD